jgi:PAS domain S-box-containing protein
MNWIVFLDVIALLASLLSLAAVWKYRRGGFSRETSLLILSLLILILIRNTGNLLQWKGGLAIMEEFEDYWELFIPLAFLFTFTGIIRDRQGSAIRQSERRYRSFVQNFRGIAYRSTLNFEPIFMDGAVEEISGYPPDEFLKGTMRWIDLIHEEDRARIHSINGRLRIEPGYSTENEYRILRSDGKTRWVRDNSTHIPESVGQSATIEGTIIDTTENRRLEDQLSHLQKMDAIGQLAGGIAHDFNNQLTGIMGYAELLVEELEEGGGREHAEAILQSAKRSSELTRQLLAFARKGQDLIMPVDLNTTVQDVISLLQRSIHRRIDIISKTHSEPLVTLGDPALIESALLNVGLNARDAISESGEILFETQTVELNAEFCRKHQNRITPGKYAQISVTDNGTGMDLETRQRIFEPFFTTKERGKGTGMGLPTAFGTLRSHHGTIDVFSDPGVGTTVKLYFPLSEGKAAKGDSPEEQRPTTGRGTILVVDDENAIREVASRMLTKLGYDTLQASDGMEAVEVFSKRSEEIDLVIIDMVMPRLGGREAFLQMKKIDPTVKALVTSGYGLDAEVHEVIEKGVQSFLKKPFQLGELSTAVNELLGR